MSEYEIERGQLDALWSYVGHKEKDDEEQESGEGKKSLLTTSHPTTRKASTGARR
jgi:hypothetical protein